jgi:diketogulonate reductase-like aldo/keto reductase
MIMIDRRSALGGGLAGIASILLPPSAMASNTGMRVVPSTGVAIPTIGLGTWITFNVGDDPALLSRSTEVMRAFFAEGGGLIDTSPMYGSAQQTIGHGLAQLGTQSTLFSADKVWTSSPQEGPLQIDAARKAWRVDHFDLVQVHNLLGVEDHLGMLFDRKASGEIDHVGITTSHGRRHADFEDVMRRYPLDFVQLTYNVLDRDAENRLLPLARDRGIGVIVNRPFQRGALIDRTRSAELPGFATELGAQNWAELMLKFVLSHPAVTVAIPATTRPEHVRQNKRAGRTAMPDEKQRKRIAEIVADL